MGDIFPALIPRQKWRVLCSRTSSTRRRIFIRAVVTATAHSRSQVAPRPLAGRTCSRQWRKLRPRRGRQAHITRIPINAHNQFILSRTHRRRPRPRVNIRPLDLLHSTTSRRSQGSNKEALLPQTGRPFLLINNRRKRHLPPRYPHPRASHRIFRPALATLRARIPSECPRSDPPFPSSSNSRSRRRNCNCIPSSNHRRPRRGPLLRCRVDSRAPILLPSSTTRNLELPSPEATASVASA